MITPTLLIVACFISVVLSLTTTVLALERNWPPWVLVLAISITLASSLVTVLLGAAYVDGAALAGCKT